MQQICKLNYNDILRKKGKQFVNLTLCMVVFSVTEGALHCLYEACGSYAMKISHGSVMEKE